MSTKRAPRPKPSTSAPTGRVLVALRIVDEARWRAVVRAALARYGSGPLAAKALDVGATTVAKWIRDDAALAKLALAPRGRPPIADVEPAELRAAVKRAGGLQAAATRLGITPQALDRYLAKGRMPQRFYDALGED